MRHDLDADATRMTPAPETFARALTRWASLQPDKTAVVDDARRLTYAELDALVDSVAAALQHRGIAPGDVVSSQLANGVDSMVLCFAAARLDVANLLGREANVGRAQAVDQLRDVLRADDRHRHKRLRAEVPEDDLREREARLGHHGSDAPEPGARRRHAA